MPAATPTPATPTVRCISLWQPWASLVVLGWKRFETRPRATRIRGRVAIHAAKRWTKAQREFLARLIDEGVVPPETGTPPLGGFVGCATITACQPIVEIRPTAGNFGIPPGPNGPNGTEISRKERMVGDWSFGRFAWQLEQAFPFPFVPARGQQGFWSVDASLVGLSDEEVAA